MIKKYRKKPVVIRALQWTGDNYAEILDFCDKAEFQYSVRKRKNIFNNSPNGRRKSFIYPNT